jgi:acetylornithine deacetylase/succinyl-diaminopimelate desuccinylase-like protein
MSDEDAKDEPKVAALLEIARAFAALSTPPERTVLFLFTTGEEVSQGLLGFARQEAGERTDVQWLGLVVEDVRDRHSISPL